MSETTPNNEMLIRIQYHEKFVFWTRCLKPSKLATIWDPRETPYPMVGNPVSWSGFCGQLFVIFQSDFCPIPLRQAIFPKAPPARWGPWEGLVAFLFEKISQKSFWAGPGKTKKTDHAETGDRLRRILRKRMVRKWVFPWPGGQLRRSFPKMGSETSVF